MNLKELKIDYPGKWEYKVVLEADKNVKNIVKNVLDEREYSIKKSQNSKKGKYSSYTVSTIVMSEDDRKGIFEELKKQEFIKFVL